LLYYQLCQEEAFCAVSRQLNYGAKSSDAIRLKSHPSKRGKGRARIPQSCMRMATGYRKPAIVIYVTT
jgi:hypothetical protein